MDINREGEKIEQEYTNFSNLLSSPEVIRDSTRLKEYSRFLKELEPKVRTFKEYRKIAAEVENLSKWLKKEKDSDMTVLLEEELKSLGSIAWPETGRGVTVAVTAAFTGEANRTSKTKEKIILVIL